MELFMLTAYWMSYPWLAYKGLWKHKDLLHYLMLFGFVYVALSTPSIINTPPKVMIYHYLTLWVLSYLSGELIFRHRQGGKT